MSDDRGRAVAFGRIRRTGIVATLAVVAASVGVALPAQASAAVPAGGVDLSKYSLVARYELPEPTRTSAPAGSLLAQEASGVTYDWDTDTLFVVGDGGTSVVQVSTTGKLIDSMTLAPGDSPAGTTFYDTEGITYVGGGKFVLGEERYRQVNLFTYVGGGTLHRADVQTVKLGTTIGNTGIEGITYDPTTTPADKSTTGLIAVKEIDPKGIFQTNVDFAAGTATNGSPTADEATNLFDPALVTTDDFSDVFALANIPGYDGPDKNNLLIISQQSGKIVNVTRTGQVQSSLDITDTGAPLSVPDETHEGVTMGPDGTIYTVNENGGGDASHPQLWVYAPTPTPRVAVTEVAPWGSDATYGADWFELTNTGATDIDLTGWKMDDSSNASASAVPLRGLTTLPAGKSAIFFENTDATKDADLITAFSQAWYGTATPPAGFLAGFYGGSGVGLSTSGDGVNLFDSAGTHVTGVSFGAATPAVTFDNSARLGSAAAPVSISTLATEGVNKAFVSADGKATGSPDGLAPVVVTPPVGGSVAVTEVAPWGSDASYGADWFELTNTGTTTVNLTGWTMDDNSNLAANAVPLTGVTTLPAGKSAVFFELAKDADPAAVQLKFTQAWFSLNAPPAGFLIGHYGGSGVGLSGSGDAVNIFDGGGNRMTGVAFGAAPTTAPLATFDNSAGLGSTTLPLPTISTLSVAGTGGAFLAADGAAVGSPGTAATPAPVVPPVVISEVAPWGSGDSPYEADWFELTNTGSSAVDLSGWTMDDNSNLFANSVPLSGLTSLPAGRSAVFFEVASGADPAAIQTAFAKAWFGTSTLPDGFLIGHYGGSGVGLSTGGDAVNIFDKAGHRVTGVMFGASPVDAPFATFDNTAGVGATTLPLPTISTLSTAGTNGAFLAKDDAEIGSPSGAAAPDRTPPVIAFAGNKGSYGLLATVAITCSATDAGTGIASATCPTASGPGWSFGAGSHTLTAQATDKAGNVANASTTFRVTVAAGDLSTLTTQFVQSSPKYKAANVLAKLLLSVSVTVASKALLDLAANTSRPAVKAALLKTYTAAVQGLAGSGWLTSSQATTLGSLAAAL
jgi:uncharacterized protein YjiK